MPLGSCGDLQQKRLVVCNCQGMISSSLWNTFTPPDDLLLKHKVVILCLFSYPFAHHGLGPTHSPLPELWGQTTEIKAALFFTNPPEQSTGRRLHSPWLCPFTGTSSVLCDVWVSAGTSCLLMALRVSPSIGYLRQARLKTVGSSFPTLTYFVQRNT